MDCMKEEGTSSSNMKSLVDLSLKKKKFNCLKEFSMDYIP